jgi:hypothetical protein
VGAAVPHIIHAVMRVRIWMPLSSVVAAQKHTGT